MAQAAQPQRPVQTIDDLVVLGRAGKEELSDGRVTVCLGGWSESRGFVRLYPTQPRMQNLKRWNKVSVPVVQDPSNDNRNESYKIAGSKNDWNTLHRKVRKTGRWDRPRRMQFVDGVPKQCPADLNDLRLSLGVVEPAEIHNAEIVKADGERSYDGRESKRNHDKLYIEYECEDCGTKAGHRQHCIEWGMYQFWKHNPDKPAEDVIDALHLFDDDWRVFFFVGNMSHQRTSYIIISILRFKKTDLDEYEDRLPHNATLGEFGGGSA